MKKLLLVIVFILSHSYLPLARAQSAIPHYIKTPTGKIEYYTMGHGKPLILIAGYFANVKSWDMTLLKKLAKENEVIVLDNRNVGGSFNSSKNYDTADLSEDVNYLIQSLHFSKINLLGISMGGMIAQQFAINYPNKVDHLILVNTFIAGVQPTLPPKEVQDDLYHPPNGKLKQYFLALRVLFPPEARYKMFFVFMRDRFNPSLKEAPLSSTVIKQQQNLVLNWIKNKNALQKIKQLKIPVLILSGGADAIIPYQNSDVLKKAIPHATMIRWQRGGHAMTFQYPKEMAKVINEWIKPV